MRPSKQVLETAEAIDRGFRGGAYTPALQTEKEKHKPWYALFLTTLTATAAGGEIIWAQMQYRKTDNEAFFTVLTADIVIVAHAEAVHLDEPLVTVRAFGRKSLAAIEVHTDQAINDTSSAALAWPGNVRVAANYWTPENEVVVFVASDKASDASKEAPVLRLLAELAKDLNS